MPEIALYGFLAGIILSFGFGSVFFALVQNSIDFGYKTAIMMACGVVASDILFIAAGLFGANYLPKIDNFDFYVRLLGSGFLILLGFWNFFEKPLPIKYPSTKKGEFSLFFVQGFLLNVVNPVNLFAWIGLITTLKGLKYTLQEISIYLLFAVLGILITESLIGFFAHKIKTVLSIKAISRMKIGTGIIFFILAATLIWGAF